MNSREIHTRAKSVLSDAVARLKGLPSDKLRSGDVCSEFDLNVPQKLLDAGCQFIAVKEILPTGDVEIAVQYRRYRFLGMSQCMADGFVIKASGRLEPLSKGRIWDLT